MGYVATKVMFRQICNCITSESISKLYMVMSSAVDNCKSAGIKYLRINICA